MEVELVLGQEVERSHVALEMTQMSGSQLGRRTGEDDRVLPHDDVVVVVVVVVVSAALVNGDSLPRIAVSHPLLCLYLCFLF